MRSDKKKNRRKHGKQEADSAAVVQADGAAVRKKKKYRLNWKRFILFLLGLMLIAVVAVCVYVGLVISQAPKIDVNDMYTILTESTVVYDDSGNEIDTVYSEENRTIVEYEDIPENMVNAMVALEDKTFWDHHGFNFIRIMGAIKESVFGGGQISGTSTITQQLARNIFLKDSRFDRDIKRKIIEAYYTVIIEKELSKEEIITLYLNTVNFGYGSYGVQAASQAYFSKDVQDLKLSECAALAALPQMPTTYQLIEYVGNDDVSEKDENILKRTSNGTYLANDASKERREICLDLMEEQGYITAEQKEKAAKRKLTSMLNPSYSNNVQEASYFKDYVIDTVIEDLMEANDWNYDTAWNKVYNGGLRIYSTMDSQAQEVIETEFDNDANFPSSSTYSIPNLTSYSSIFDSDKNFTLKTSEII